MTKKLGAALAIMGAAVAPSQATPVTVSQTISLADLLSSSGTASSTVGFNMNAQLAAVGHTSGDVISGDLVVFGYSDGAYDAASAEPYSGYATIAYGSHTAYQTYTYSYYVPRTCYDFWGASYQCGYVAYGTGSYGWSVTDRSEGRSRTVDHVDVTADQMTVTAGASSTTAADSTHVASVGSYGNWNYEGTGGNYYDGYIYYYNRERDSFDAVMGPIQASLSLDDLALGDLTADGLMDAVVTASLGHFTVTSATLTVTAETRVPEPGTLGLFGIAALGGIAARRRGRKKNNAA